MHSLSLRVALRISGLVPTGASGRFRLSGFAGSSPLRTPVLEPYSASMNRVLEIFRKINPLLGAARWNLPGVNERTQRRWFEEGDCPTGPSAKAVANGVWQRIHQ